MKKIILPFFAFTQIISSLNSQSVNHQKLQELIHFNDSLYASEILVIYKGEEILYWKDTTCEKNSFNASSMQKSWTGLAFGTLLDHGFINSLDEKACVWLPEWKDGCEKEVTLYQLITMTAGLNRRGGRGILAQEDNLAYVLNTPLDTLPGIRWEYSNESVQLLGIILERASGMNANDYFKKYLFDKLGMKSTQLVKDRAGKSWITYGGAQTSIREAAKIGVLMLQKGKYNGVQVVSEEWINASVQPNSLSPVYGYLWWVDHRRFVNHIQYAAMGDPGVMTIILPEYDLIFVRNQACKNYEPNHSNLYWMNPGFFNTISAVFD